MSIRKVILQRLQILYQQKLATCWVEVQSHKQILNGQRWFGDVKSIDQTTTSLRPGLSQSPVTTSFPASNEHYYKRILPASCVAFGSEDGKKLLVEAILGGYANIYFPLAEQFRTQTEPAYCGLSTLVMVLNALAVDPKRVWKGPWRWYHEEMLDCCLPLDVVQQQGITMEQFVCLAACNNLDLNVVRMSDKESIDDFRKVVKKTCSGSGRILVCSYSRSSLGQTGDGHFSPIGAYHAEKDMVLIFDVARFKYPLHWVSVEMMWQAMKEKDESIGLARGYMVMQKSNEIPLLLFRLSNTFRVTIASKHLLNSNMAKFLTSWNRFLLLNNNCSLVCSNLETAVIYALSSLNEALGMILEGESVFTTQFTTSGIEALPREHIKSIHALLKAIEQTKLYEITHKWVTDFERNNPSVLAATVDFNSKSLLPCSSHFCNQIDGFGLPVVGDLGKPLESMKDESRSTETQSRRGEDCDKVGNKLITNSHYITMFMLSWPYNTKTCSTYASFLSRYVDQELGSSGDVLQNESKHLRHQIKSLVMILEAYE